MRRPLASLLLLPALAAGCRGPVPAEVPDHALPPLEEPGKEYRTPRAGEGFRTEVAGRQVAVQPRDRRRVTAWDVGVATVAPGVSEGEALPFASVYLWRRPDQDTFLRAVLVGLYNEVFFAKSAKAIQPLEGILTLNSQTIPFDQALQVDGIRQDGEELLWGRVHPGIGIGYREDVGDLGAIDNMLAISFLGEPGFLYFSEGKDTEEDFRIPEDTFDGRLRLKARLDAMERNLLELPHRGVATGGDLVYGYRPLWRDWGVAGREDAKGARDYAYFTGYMVGAGGVPFVPSDRHRLLGSIHGGVGDGLDRFSGLRTGGGPSGNEYEAISRPTIPGALVEEFTTSRYAIALGEYRWEPIFFAYLSLRVSLSYLERDRLVNGAIEQRDDVLASAGARITTGFLFETRIQLDYNYNAGVLRHGEYGGHEVVMHVSGQF